MLPLRGLSGLEDAFFFLGRSGVLFAFLSSFGWPIVSDLTFIFVALLANTHTPQSFFCHELGILEGDRGAGAKAETWVKF